MASLRAGLRLAIGVIALSSDIDVARAAPFDFLFAEPSSAPRPRQRRRAPPHPQAKQQPQPDRRADIPLPVPRPHFASDPAPGRQSSGQQDTAARAAPAPRLAEAPAAKPIETPAVKPPEAPAKAAQAPDAGVPLPPPKPAEIETPAKPPDIAKPSVTEKPAAIGTGTGRTETGRTETKPAETKPAEPVKPSTPPTVAPSGATTAFMPRSPNDDPQCPGRLASRHVDAEKSDIGPQPDERCTVLEPVRLADLALADGSKVDFPDRPTISCTTADAFSSYVRDLLVPLAKGTFGAPVVAVWTGPGLECRSRDHIFGAKLSAHGQGLAIDIAQVKLADGRLIEVGTPKTDAETGFETAARAGACGYFHTVLGPGSDAYHRTHWHFDLEVRGSHGDGKYCK